MRRVVGLVLSVIAFSSCSGERRYELEGQILFIDPARQEMTVRHGDIKGFMPGMTMAFRVSDPRSLVEHRPGELIKAILVVSDSTGRLRDIVRTGEAPLPPDTPVSILARGDLVPDARFVDQQGRERRLSEWRGRRLAVTFIYTRCPLPDFCPLMDRNFAAIQRQLQEEPSLARSVHLLSVSFDPEFDTPEVLRAHAQRVGADDETWTFATGRPEDVDKFARALGLSILKEKEPVQPITHNLRTIVLDRNGRFVEVFNGNDWKWQELFEILRPVSGR
jgi:protein SCO1/2